MASRWTTRTGLGVVGQVALGAALLTAGTGHLTKQREEFQAQVPEWSPADPDVVVVVSGLVELALAAALVATWKQPARALVGTAAAAFFVAVFPGNIAQYTGHVDAFGLDTDTKRAVRLVFQPVLVAWALASTGAVQVFREQRLAQLDRCPVPRTWLPGGQTDTNGPTRRPLETVARSSETPANTSDISVALSASPASGSQQRSRCVAQASSASGKER